MKKNEEEEEEDEESELSQHQGNCKARCNDIVTNTQTEKRASF